MDQTGRARANWFENISNFLHNQCYNAMFPKDLLFIDFETTGSDPDQAKPLQIGALLLDKATLAEKAEFVSYIKQDLTDGLAQGFG